MERRMVEGREEGGRGGMGERGGRGGEKGGKERGVREREER